MNVEQGDLAYTTSTISHRNVGRFVEVLKFVGEHVYACGSIGTNTWLVRLLGSGMKDSFGMVWSGDVYIDDSNLRPIRPGEGSDETLSWCPVPSKVTA